jgi:hypothetical protein
MRANRGRTSFPSRLAALAAALFAAGIGTAEAPDDLARISLEKQAVFASPEGGPVSVPAGAYRVAAAPETGLSLEPVGGGAAFVIAAETGSHEETLGAAVAASEPGEGDGAGARHVLLYLPDGSLREAVGTDGPVLERGTPKLVFPPKQRQKILLGKLGSKLPGKLAQPPTGQKPAGASGAESVQLPVSCTWDTMDIIDPRIDDLGAQKSLMRKLRMSSPPKDRAEGSAMLTAIKNGTLEAIFREFRPAVGKRAVKLGRSSGAALLDGAHAACVTQPPGERPLIVFRGGLSEAQIDAALSVAWSQCDLPTPLPPCDYNVVLKPAGGPECRDDEDCEDNERPYCHPDTGTCVQCYIDAHCHELDFCSHIDNYCHEGQPGEKPLPCGANQCYLDLESTCPHPRVCVPDKGPNPNRCGTCITKNREQIECYDKYEKEWKAAVEACNRQKHVDDALCVAEAVPEWRRPDMGFELGKCVAEARRNQLACFKKEPAEAKRKQSQCFDI